MAWITFGGIAFGGMAGFVLGSMLSQLLFGPRVVAARPLRPPVRRAGNPGAAFLLTIIAVFGGVAVGGLAAGIVGV